MGVIAERVLAVLLTCGVASLPATAQTPQNLTGTWQGTLAVGNGQRIVLKISQATARWQAVVYNLDADMAYLGRNTTQMSMDNGLVRFAVAPIDTSYQGKLSPDGTSIAGAWKQGSGDAHPLTLTRVEGDAAWEIPRADAMMAKDADPDWEVATVKPADPNETTGGFHLKGPRIHIQRMTVESMVLVGYNLHKKQLEGAPDWIATERWDIEGVADTPGKPALKQFQSLTRKILAERFAFKAHTDTREMAVYALTIAKGGPKLTSSAGDPNGLMSENDSANAGQRSMRMTNSTVSDFVLLIKNNLDRPVIDQTGLTGRYDLALKWTFDESQAPTDGTAAPNLFTAVQEQIGLKLEPVKAPAEVLVIDHVERPSAN